MSQKSENKSKEAAVARLRKHKTAREKSTEALLEGLLSGDIAELSNAVTLIESTKPEDQQKAQKLVAACVPHAEKSIRLGITGVPGVGKSTFIEGLGQHLIAKGHKVAVLAIDPTSQRTKGSILGDKTRMERLAQLENAFIRPSPSAEALGGVAQKTRETMLLCEAAGFDVILVETVGVGQSEIAVHGMVDFFLLLMLAGAGDELQGIKRGIMEMAHGIAINKADGNNVKQANNAARAYKNALHVFPPDPSGWIPQVLTCSALEQENLETVWQLVVKQNEHLKIKGLFDQKRRAQDLHWMDEAIARRLKTDFYGNEAVKAKLSEMHEMIKRGKIDPFSAAQKVLDAKS